MNRSTFATSPDNRCFEDYAAEAVHEFGSMSVEENGVFDFTWCSKSGPDVTLNHDPRSILRPDCRVP